MKRLLIAAMLLASTAAFAQPAEKTYSLTVTATEIGVLAEALGEIPAKRANPLIAKLNQQITAQDAAAKKAEEPKPEAPKP